MSEKLWYSILYSHSSEAFALLKPVGLTLSGEYFCFG